MNRWNTVLGGLLWWLFGIKLFGALPEAFLRLPYASGSDEASLIAEATSLGVQTDSAFRELRAARYKKACAWVRDVLTGRRLSTGAVIFVEVDKMLCYYVTIL